jgi:hypothetical protein
MIYDVINDMMYMINDMMYMINDMIYMINDMIYDMIYLTELGSHLLAVVQYTYTHTNNI